MSASSRSRHIPESHSTELRSDSQLSSRLTQSSRSHLILPDDSRTTTYSERKDGKKTSRTDDAGSGLTSTSSRVSSSSSSSSLSSSSSSSRLASDSRSSRSSSSSTSSASSASSSSSKPIKASASSGVSAASQTSLETLSLENVLPVLALPNIPLMKAKVRCDTIYLPNLVCL